MVTKGYVASEASGSSTLRQSAYGRGRVDDLRQRAVTISRVKIAFPAVGPRHVSSVPPTARVTRRSSDHTSSNHPTGTFAPDARPRATAARDTPLPPPPNHKTFK